MTWGLFFSLTVLVFDTMCAVELEVNMVFNDCPALQLFLMKLQICRRFLKLRKEIFIYFKKLTDSNSFQIFLCTDKIIVHLIKNQ